ncbi:hypothetical protein Tco_0225981 [Tanacetum coccineum]
METEAIDNQANLVNYDNENEYEIEDLGYESEEYTEDAHEDDENNHSNGYAKRGITRLCKFRREYGKPGGVKLSVTFDALNRISEKQRALFLSFLGDMVREHIVLQILSWKKVGPEARNKLWDEITLVMNRLGQLLGNFRRKLRKTYILPNQDTPSKLNEVPAKYSAILKAEDWVNFVNYTATEEYKVKSAKAKMARSKCVFPHTMGRGYAHMKEKMIRINIGSLQMSQPANDEFSQHLIDDEASNHEDASDTGAAPKQQQQVFRMETQKRHFNRKDGVIEYFHRNCAEIQEKEALLFCDEVLFSSLQKQLRGLGLGLDEDLEQIRKQIDDVALERWT